MRLILSTRVLLFTNQTQTLRSPPSLVERTGSETSLSLSFHSLGPGPLNVTLVVSYRPLSGTVLRPKVGGGVRWRCDVGEGVPNDPHLPGTRGSDPPEQLVRPKIKIFPFWLWSVSTEEGSRSTSREKELKVLWNNEK